MRVKVERDMIGCIINNVGHRSRPTLDEAKIAWTLSLVEASAMLSGALGAGTAPLCYARALGLIEPGPPAISRFAEAPLLAVWQRSL